MRKKIGKYSMIGMFCIFVFVFCIPIAEGWADTEYLYKRQVTIDSSYIDNVLTDFPVMISAGSPDCGFYLTNKDKIRSDGADVTFYDSTETVILDYEKSFYDSRNSLSTMEYFVEVPSVSSSSDTFFWVYYGNKNISHIKEPDDYYDTWDNDFLHVCHLNGLLETIYFSSHRQTGLEAIEIVPESLWNSPCGESMKVDTFTSYLKCTEQFYFNDFSGYTLSMVIRTASGAGDSNDGKGIHVMEGHVDDRGKFSIYFINDSGTMKIRAMIEDRFPTNYVSANYSYSDNTNYHVTATFNETDVYLYINGVEVGHNNNSAGTVDFDNMATRVFNLQTNDISAKIDNIRFSNVMRNSSWIKACYYNWFLH